jgi:hypothetical protein
MPAIRKGSSKGSGPLAASLVPRPVIVGLVFAIAVGPLVRSAALGAEPPASRRETLEFVNR